MATPLGELTYTLHLKRLKRVYQADEEAPLSKFEEIQDSLQHEYQINARANIAVINRGPTLWKATSVHAGGDFAHIILTKDGKLVDDISTNLWYPDQQGFWLERIKATPVPRPIIDFILEVTS